VERIDISTAPRELAKGDLLGWFNMGSTVIVLLPKNSCTWHDDFEAGASTVMGQAIGVLAAPGA
jgi:phosphatidylserine decarboxylase